MADEGFQEGYDETHTLIAGMLDLMYLEHYLRRPLTTLEDFFDRIDYIDIQDWRWRVFPLNRVAEANTLKEVEIDRDEIGGDEFRSMVENEECSEETIAMSFMNMCNESHRFEQNMMGMWSPCVWGWGEEGARMEVSLSK